MQVSIVDLKGKGPIQGTESPAEEKSDRDMFRLCIWCKAKMAEEDWNALLSNAPKEAKKWFAFIDNDEGADCHCGDQSSRQCVQGVQ